MLLGSSTNELARKPNGCVRQFARHLISTTNLPVPLSMRVRATRHGSLKKMALVALDLSFLYVVVPKAANSTIKRALWQLQGVRIRDDATAELNLGPGPYKSLEELPAPNLKRVLKSRDTFRFTFVRNPYGRLLSAYRDKILDLNGIGYRDFYARKLGLDAGAGFAEFVAAVAREADDASDWHWMTQARCAMTNLVRYDFIGRIETFSTDIATVFRRIAPGIDSASIPSAVNRLPKPGPDEFFYTELLAEKVFRRYRQDFKLFDYDGDSWRGL